jgi:hypothetical protein
VSLYDAAYCLARVKQYAGLPAADDSIDDDGWYALLTEAQLDWAVKIATQVPKSQWGAAVQMTTGDGGTTYTVGTGMSLVEEFAGPIELRVSNRGLLITPDQYILDGATVRWPFGTTRAFAAGPYVRYAAVPGAISDEDDPTLQPARARILLVYGALKRWGNIGGGYRDPSYWETLEMQEWFGDGAGKIGLLDNLQAAYPTTDAELEEAYAPWYQMTGDLT